MNEPSAERSTLRPASHTLWCTGQHALLLTNHTCTPFACILKMHQNQEKWCGESRSQSPTSLPVVDLVRHRIHSGGFQAYTLRFVSVFGSAKAGIHRGKLGSGLKSTAFLPRGSHRLCDTARFLFGDNWKYDREKQLSLNNFGKRQSGSRDGVAQRPCEPTRRARGGFRRRFRRRSPYIRLSAECW